MTQSDSTTFDLGQTCLRLKDGLEFSVQQGKLQTWYLIEDESRAQFFRIGAPEYTFLSLLDGQTTMSMALSKTCSLMGVQAFSEQDAVSLCKWLVDVELAHTGASTAAVRLRDRHQSSESSQQLQKLNPIAIRIPLFELDSFTTVAVRYLGWLVSWRFAIVWAIVCLLGLVSLCLCWDKAEYVNVLSRNNWFWLALTWVVLKMIHEFSHVLACKKLGGQIGKGGILFLLMIPMPFVDVTSSWRFNDKYSRILVSAAGMLAEMLLAAIAAIVWSRTGPGALNYHAANVMIAASLHTLLFNANPLMRFDGYYMLCDWLEMPNLGNHGSQYLKGVGRKWFFDLPSTRLQYEGFHGQIVQFYGVAAFVWKILICVGLGIGAVNLFHGFGLVMALFGVVMWLAMPVCQLLKFVAVGTEFEVPNRRRFAMVVAGIFAGVGLFGCLVPAPSIINAPIVIEYHDKEIVRAESSGFVRQILVDDEEFVKKGDLLFVLENRELESEIAKIKLDLSKAKLRSRALQNDSEIGAWQAEQSVIESLEKQLFQIESKQRKLEIVAPSDGQVVDRGVMEKKGLYVPAGTELVTIGDAHKKEVIGLVSQDDARYLADKVGMEVDLRVWGIGPIHSVKFTEIEPKAVDDLPHLAFAGNYGGPIDVVERKHVEDSNEKWVSEDAELMMTQPRVPVRMQIAPDIGQQLKSGQTGLVHIRGRSQSVGSYLVDKSARWLQRNIKTFHGL